MELLWRTLCFLTLSLLVNTEDLPVAIEPLLTPLFLKDMSPLILSSLTRTLRDTDIPIPPQTIHLPLSRPIQIHVTSLRVTDLKWTQGSGLFFDKGQVLGFSGSLDAALRASYVTDSRLRLPSGNLTVRVQGCHVRAGIQLDLHPTELILIPRFEYLDIHFDSMTVKTDEKRLINWLSKLLNPLIKSSTSKILSVQLKLLTTSLIETVSRSEFEVPFGSGVYRTEFTRSPVISERGMVLDMALYRSAGQQLGNLTVLSQTSRRGVKKRDMHVSERSRSLSFTMAQPSHRTSLQPFLTPAFLTQLNPILLSSIEAGLGALDLSVSQTVRNPMRPNAAMEINMTRLRIYDVQWDKGSGVMFGDGVIKVNASLSSKVDVSYFTNSKVLLPSGDLDLDVKNCHVSADLGFHYSPKQLSWVPYFQRLDVSFGAIDIRSSTIHLMRAISFLLAPLIRSRAAQAIKSNLETLLPGLIQNVFSTEVDVPFVGVLKAQFMRGPSIAPDGMLVDMRLVPVV